MNAVERARMSHSDDVTSSSTLLNHPSGDGFGESLCFSGFTAMSGSQREELWCGGNEGVRRLEVWNLSSMNGTLQHLYRMYSGLDWR